MSGGKRDAEADLRHQLAQSARSFVVLLSRGQTKAEAAVDLLAERAFGSSERLRDAAALLGDEDAPARALLTRAVRYAIETRQPAPPRREPLPDASRYGGSGASAPAPGVMSRGGCYSGNDPRPTS
jgi:hypothetical protein